MNIRALQYFIALAELKHFRKAAERCHVSQPTLSTQIKKLEEQLGTDLIERNSRQVMLTTVGQRILESAKRIVNETAAIRQMARDADDPFAGVLSLGVFPTLAPYLLPHTISKLRSKFPRLTLRLFEEKTDKVLTMLASGALDAILLALPLHDEQMHVEELFDEPFVLMTPRQHALAKRRTVSVEDLDVNELLLLEDGHCLRQHALEICGSIRGTERLDFQASSLETLRYMVASESGITLMPIIATKAPIPQIENVAITPFQEPAPQRTIAMA